MKIDRLEDFTNSISRNMKNLFVWLCNWKLFRKNLVRQRNYNKQHNKDSERGNDHLSCCALFNTTTKKGNDHYNALMTSSNISDN